MEKLRSHIERFEHKLDRAKRKLEKSDPENGPLLNTICEFEVSLEELKDQLISAERKAGSDPAEREKLKKFLKQTEMSWFKNKTCTTRRFY